MIGFTRAGMQGRNHTCTYYFNERMATEEFNDDLPIDSPERKRLPLLLRRA